LSKATSEKSTVVHFSEVEAAAILENLGGPEEEPIDESMLVVRVIHPVLGVHVLVGMAKCQGE